MLIAVIHLDVRGLNVKNEALSKSIQTVNCFFFKSFK